MNRSILYISPVSFHGGAEEVLLSYMEAAKESQYFPVLVAPTEGWLTAECRGRDIPVEILPTLPDVSLPSATKQFLPMAWNGVQIARIARKWGGVIVHSNSPRSSYHGGLGARFAGIAAVTHIHDVSNPPYRTSMRARILNFLADWTITVSNAVRQEIIRIAPQFQNKINTIYNGWDIARYDQILAADLRKEFNIPQNATILISGSAISEHKGQHLLIPAYEYLQEKHNNLRLLIVGSAQNYPLARKYEEALHQRVADVGMGQEIIFTGWREDIIALIKGADILLHTPTQFDSLPTVLLHGIATGRPVVATNIGGIAEIVLNGQNGFVVEPDPQKIANAISKILVDNQLSYQFGQNGINHFRNTFSHEKMRSKLINVYDKVQGVVRYKPNKD
jgi:glycosyltransferase involved in cell wall biosynthesis